MTSPATAGGRSCSQCIGPALSAAGPLHRRLHGSLKRVEGDRLRCWRTLVSRRHSPCQTALMHDQPDRQALTSCLAGSPRAFAGRQLAAAGNRGRRARQSTDKTPPSLAAPEYMSASVEQLHGICERSPAADPAAAAPALYCPSSLWSCAGWPSTQHGSTGPAAGSCRRAARVGGGESGGTSRQRSDALPQSFLAGSFLSVGWPSPAREMASRAGGRRREGERAAPLAIGGRRMCWRWR